MDEPLHDEINLIRLLRRLEKSVSNKEEWQPSSPEIWLKTQSALQVSINFVLFPLSYLPFFPEGKVCTKVDQECRV